MSTRTTRRCKDCGAGNRPAPYPGPRCATHHREHEKSLHPDGLICTKCKKVKPSTSFSNDSSRTSGKFPYCKSCQNKYMTGRPVQDPGARPNGRTCPLCDAEIRGHANRRYCSNYCKDRTKSVKTKYGLDVEQYRSLIDATGGRCPICEKRVRKWVVEHNHFTNEVTGVVCTRCNVGVLAYSNHDIDTVRRLLAYLEDPPARTIGPLYAPDDPDGKLRGKSKLHGTWR